jgi:hypothetical protein
MKPDLGFRYAPGWKGVPPHISSEDFEIWKRWRDTDLPANALSWYFDVGLGGQVVEHETDEALTRMWRRVTSKRADVVLEYPDRWIIVELRFAASASALGRLAQYKTLWQEDPPDDRPVDLVLVTDRLDPDLERVASNFGITSVQI